MLLVLSGRRDNLGKWSARFCPSDQKWIVLTPADFPLWSAPGLVAARPGDVADPFRTVSFLSPGGVVHLDPTDVDRWIELGYVVDVLA